MIKAVDPSVAARKLFSFGNKKLPKSTAIFNLCAASNCPSEKLGLCQLPNAGKCYAKKAERIYKAVLPYRKRQEIFWQTCSVQDFMKAFSQAVGKKKVKHLRFGESGDFRTQADVDKAQEIAELLWEHKKVRVYCFTARSDLDFSKCTHLTVNGSGFMVHNSFTVHPRNTPLDALPGVHVCGGDCKVCSRCAQRQKRKIVTAEH